MILCFSAVVQFWLGKNCCLMLYNVIPLSLVSFLNTDFTCKPEFWNYLKNICLLKWEGFSFYKAHFFLIALTSKIIPCVHGHWPSVLWAVDLKSLSLNLMSFFLLYLLNRGWKYREVNKNFCFLKTMKCFLLNFYCGNNKHKIKVAVLAHFEYTFQWH